MLVRYLDDFYEIISIFVLVGYGLMEMVLVINVRVYKYNLCYFFGCFIFFIEICIVDMEIKEDLFFEI